MWVASTVRGIGLGKRLLGHLEDEARASGRTRVVLDTNGSLTEAISMYRALGYTAIERYNDNPYAHHWFEKTLMPGTSDLDAALARVPFLAGNLTATNELTTTRLAGLTNVNHLVLLSDVRAVTIVTCCAYPARARANTSTASTRKLPLARPRSQGSTPRSCSSMPRTA